jgi:hypothetical protein
MVSVEQRRGPLPFGGHTSCSIQSARHCRSSILFVISARPGELVLGEGCELFFTQAEIPHLSVFRGDILDRIAIKYDSDIGPAQACNPFVVDRFTLRRRTCPEMGECPRHDRVGIVDNYFSRVKNELGELGITW